MMPGSAAAFARVIAAAGGSWANAYSYRVNDGGATNEFAIFGQPTGIVGVTHNNTARSYSLWYRNNSTGTDCTYFAVAEQTNRPVQLYSVSGQPTVYLGTNQMSYGTASTSGVWYHMCVTCSSAGAMTLYINATSRATGTAGSAAQSYDLTMGARRNSANTGSAWTGPCNVDEVTVWDKQLSGSEVTELYNAGDPFDPETHSAASNLIYYWQMGDGDTLPTITTVVGSTSYNGAAQNSDSGDFEAAVP